MDIPKKQAGPKNWILRKPHRDAAQTYSYYCYMHTVNFGLEMVEAL